jgi:hypothetical protein
MSVLQLPDVLYNFMMFTYLNYQDWSSLCLTSRDFQRSVKSLQIDAIYRLRQHPMPKEVNTLMTYLSALIPCLKLSPVVFGIRDEDRQVIFLAVRISEKTFASGKICKFQLHRRCFDLMLTFGSRPVNARTLNLYKLVCQHVFNSLPYMYTFPRYRSIWKKTKQIFMNLYKSPLGKEKVSS